MSASRRCLPWLTVLLLIALNPLHAGAQNAFPNRVVRIVVPSTSGGGGDALARLLAHHLTERWDKQVIVENRTSASNMILGLPHVRDITEKIYRDTATVLKMPEVRDRLSADGAQFAMFIKSETVKWAKVVKAAGIVPE